MKIITWNCNMAFRKKANMILSEKPDILVVPECENPDRLNFGTDVKKPVDSLWFGTNPNKGLGIFSYSHYRFSLLPVHNDDLKMIVPISVTGGPFDFNMFAIWANNPVDKDGRYITQVWKALHHYDDLLSSAPTILLGDFNSNTIWDKPRREGNHSTVVQQLARKGIQSVYHTHYNQAQGSEQHPTLYMYRKKEQPYHIDYCFASSEFMTQLRSVEIGTFDTWCKHSDHVPLMVTFGKT